MQCHCYLFFLSDIFKRYSKFHTKTLFFIALKISNFVPNSHHLCEILLHHFISKKIAAESYRILAKFYGEHALSETKCRDWFRRFKSGDFDLSNRDRGKTLKKLEDAELQAMLDEDSTQNLKQLVKALGVDQGTISRCFTCHCKDSERRKMGAVRIKIKRHWRANNHLWNFVSSFQKKVIFASHCYWRWKVELFRQSQAQKSMGRPWPTINIITSTEYSWKAGFAVYLVGSEGSCILWTAKTRWNGYW